MKELLKKRIVILNQEIQQSIMNHNMLLGHLNELNHLLKELEEGEKAKAESESQADGDLPDAA